MHRTTAYMMLAIACVGLAVIAAGCGGGGARGPYTIAGTVKDDVDNPVEGAVVTATVQGEASPVDTTTTSSTGGFAFALPSGTYVIEASKGGLSDREVVTITASQAALSLALVLTEQPPPPPNVTGVVHTAALAPVAGATVTARKDGVLVDTTATDATGMYSFGLLAGQTYVLAATATGFNPAQQTVVLPVGGWVVVNFTLEPS